MTMQVFPNGQKADFIKPKPIGHVFHSSPARTKKCLLLTNTGFECFNNSDKPAKTSQALKLNVKGNGLPSEKSLESVEDETPTTNNSIHSDNYDGSGPEFFKKSRGKQAKNIRNTLLPQLCYELKERQKHENLSTVGLSSSPTLPAFSSSVMYKKMATKQSKSLSETQDLSPSRGIMVHTGRYQWTNKKSELLSESPERSHFSSFQRQLHPLHHKQITIPPIRANTLHVVLGGKKIEMEERFSLMREIQKLKCVVLPDHARHLFHGKGFKLPLTHGSIKPRGISIPDDDKDDIGPALQHLKCRQSTDINGHKTRDHFPLIKKSSTFTGLTAPSTVQLSKQKIVVKRLKTKLNLLPSPTSPPPPPPLQNQPPPPPPQISKNYQVNNMAVTPNTTMNSRNSNEMADMTNKNGDEKIAKTKDFDELQEKEENREDEEVTSKIPAAIEDKADDSKSIGSNENEDNYQNHLSGNNLKPLIATPLETVPSSEQDTLKETFNKLDSDKDGHLLYSQLKSLLPEKFSINQEKFIKEVYNITSQSTFFGISEFWGMTQLTKNIESLSGPALEAYDLLNFETLNDSIAEYLTDFQDADPSFKGNLSLTALCALLSKHTKQNFLTNKTLWNQVLSNIALTDTDSIRKTNFLAHLPYFLSLT